MSKITNDKVSVPTGTELNEKDYLNITLSYLKDIQKNMCISMTEASNEKLFKIFGKMFQDITELQRTAYNTAFKFGWYELETPNKTKLDEKYNNLLNELNSLNEEKI